jgi:hypothetical protein
MANILYTWGFCNEFIINKNVNLGDARFLVSILYMATHFTQEWKHFSWNPNPYNNALLAEPNSIADYEKTIVIEDELRKSNTHIG